MEAERRPRPCRQLRLQRLSMRQRWLPGRAVQPGPRPALPRGRLYNVVAVQIEAVQRLVQELKQNATEGQLASLSSQCLIELGCGHLSMCAGCMGHCADTCVVRRQHSTTPL